MAVWFLRLRTRREAAGKAAPRRGAGQRPVGKPRHHPPCGRQAGTHTARPGRSTGPPDRVARFGPAVSGGVLAPVAHPHIGQLRVLGAVRLAGHRTRHRRSETRACPARRSASSRPPAGHRGAAAGPAPAPGPAPASAVASRRPAAWPSSAGRWIAAAASAPSCAAPRVAAARQWGRRGGSARAAPAGRADAPCPPPRSSTPPGGGRSRRLNAHPPRARAGERSSPHSTPYRGSPIRVTTKYGRGGSPRKQHENPLRPQKLVENSRFDYQGLIAGGRERRVPTPSRQPPRQSRRSAPRTAPPGRRHAAARRRRGNHIGPPRPAAPSAQNSSPLRSSPCTPFSPFTVWVTWKSTASEQN